MLYQKLKSKINLLILIMSLSWIILVVFIGYSFTLFRDEMHLSTHGKEKLQASLFKLQAENEGADILRLFKKDKKSEVNKYFEQLKVKHQDLEQWLKSNSVKNWNEMMVDAQQLMTSIESERSLNILESNSLKNNIQNLRELALRNNWKRIILMTDQMQVFADKKKNTLIRSSLHSIEEILSISTLEQKDKDLILQKCANISEVIDQLQKKSELTSSLEEWAQQFMSQKEIVIMDLKVQLAGSEKRIESAYNFFLRNALIGLILAMMVMIGSYFLIQKWSNDWQLKFENDLDLFLRDDIFRGKQTLKSWVREKTQKQFKRHIDFILQKLDLGREFETGVPLPCFIINHHCQITWGNDLFLEQFSLESHELGKEYLDWKFISKYLLLGDEDPIEKTIMEKVPGVYQVKIKFDDMMTKSYEMHVSPMCTESGEKILILFYPLAFIEESIHSQIQLISKPLEHIIPKIDLMNLQNEEVQSEVNFWIEEIKKSGQDKIYNDLLKLRDRIIEQFNYSADQVSKLSQELQDSKQSLGLIKEESTHFIEEFKNTKSISEHWSEIIDDNQNQIKDFKLVEKKIIKEIRHLNLGIETLKRQIQEIKNKIADAQQYLQQLDQFRKNPDDLKLLESLVMKIQFTLNIYPTEMMDLSLREDSMPSLHQILEKIETNKEKSLVELEKLVEIQSSLFLHAKAINQFNKSKPINQELLS